MLTRNLQQFWCVVNPKHKRTSTLADVASDAESTNAFNVAFASVFTIKCDMISSLQRTTTRERTMPEIVFSTNGLLSQIEHLNITSSAGFDEINLKFLLNTKNISANYLCLLYSQFLSTGDVPDDWKVGKVIPIHKSGNRQSPLKDRPISLTSIPCKIVEHVIYSQIMNFLDSNNFFNSSKHSFRKGLSCETQLANFLQDLR